MFLQTAWIVIKRNAEWKPLQFLAFVFVYRIFEKLKAFEPPPSTTFTVSYDCTWKFRLLPSCISGILRNSFFFCFLGSLNYLSGYWMQEDGEDEGRALRMGKRLLRSLALVFGCIAVSSLVCNSGAVFCTTPKIVPILSNKLHLYVVWHMIVSKLAFSFLSYFIMWR